jgi:hypothetical protein
MISVIIPCYNQGRFLIDCLESLAGQTVLPGEVVLANDGSTDPHTLALCERLPHYDFPFPLIVLHHANRGLPGTRNRAVRHTRGEVIVPLDSDDTLLPTALEDFGRFLERNPQVDVCFPDVFVFGLRRENYLAHHYNPWRHTQHNWLVPACAIRRRVFEAGYWYDEEMRDGFEDWEFYLRTCALGPFVAAPLKKLAFAYRRWGYTMYDLMDRPGQVARMRRRHTELGLWSATRAVELRTEHAPAHCWFSDAPEGDRPQEDLAVRPLADMQRTLDEDPIPRFLWLGQLPTQDPAAIRFLVNALAGGERSSPLYAFFRGGEEVPYLIVIDRLAVLAGHCAIFYRDPPLVRAVLVRTRGEVFPCPTEVRVELVWEVPAGSPLAALGSLRLNSLFPVGVQEDTRLRQDMYYYFRRDCAEAAFVHPPEGSRTLAIACDRLDDGPHTRFLHAQLAGRELREHFDRIYLVVFEPGEHPLHDDFETCADGIYHLGSAGLSAEEKAAWAMQLLRDVRAEQVLVVESAAGLGLIPEVRAAELAVRFTAVLAPCPEGHMPGPDSAARILASRYAGVVARALVPDEATASLLCDLLYVPAERVDVHPLGCFPDGADADPSFWHLLLPLGRTAERRAA